MLVHPFPRTWSPKGVEGISVSRRAFLAIPGFKNKYHIRIMFPFQKVVNMKFNYLTLYVSFELGLG